jgi:hypothetical protein
VDLEVYSSGKTLSYCGSGSGSGSGGNGGDGVEGSGDDEGNDAYVMRANGSGQGERRYPSYLVEPPSAIQSVEREHRFEDSLASYKIDSADLGDTLLSPSRTLSHPLTPLPASHHRLSPILIIHLRWHGRLGDILRGRKEALAGSLSGNGCDHQRLQQPLRRPQHPRVPRR